MESRYDDSLPTVKKNCLANERDYHFKKIGNNRYNINFSMKNDDRIRLENNFNNVNFYSFLFSINKELIESFEILNQTNNSIDFFILLKPIGKKMGITQKYLLLNVETRKESDEIFIITGKTQEDIVVKTHVAKLSIFKKDLEQVVCKYLNLYMNKKEKCINLNLEYEVNTVEEDLPVFLKNMFGIMIKNMFLQLNLFIENRH